MRSAKQVFGDALECPSAQRDEYLAQACAGDSTLRARVEELLNAHAAAETFLQAEAPCAKVLTRLPEQPGARLGPYKLIEMIGEGGFGAVFLVEQETPIRRRVAVKIIKLGMDTRQVIARFEAERQALALMDHPNIARVLDAGATDAGRPYFVMELVRGVPITQFCDEHRVPLRRRLELFQEVCHAIQHAHQKGIIHRDLKPSNVLVSRHDDKPVVKVIDFGIAKATGSRLTDKTVQTEWRQLIGTPAYMSPEQAGLSDLDIDTRGDIYSLGVLLYELLTGTTPFDTSRIGGFEELWRTIREVEPRKPSTRVASDLRVGRRPAPGVTASRLSEPLTQVRGQSEPDAQARDSSVAGKLLASGSDVEHSAAIIAQRRDTDPKTLSRTLRGDLDWIVMKCLEKDRTRRYETANALALDIGRHLAGEPIVAAPPSRAYRLRKFLRRNRGTVIAGSLVALSLLAAVIGTTTFALREAQQRRLAEKQAEETRRVADFQGKILTSIDVPLMGDRQREDLLNEAQRAWRRTGLSEEEIAQRQLELNTLLKDANFTNTAIANLERNVFDPALRAIEEQFGGEPRIKAQLLQLTALTMRNLNLIEQAMAPQAEALEIRHRELGEAHRDTIASIRAKAFLLESLGRYSEAERDLRRAIEVSHAEHGDEALDTLAAKLDLSFLLFRQQRPAEGEPYAREVLQAYRRMLGNEHIDTLLAMRRTAQTLRVSDEAEAEALIQEALETGGRALGTDHPEVLRSQLLMATLRQDQGRLLEAEPYLQSALAGLRRMLGDGHQDTVKALEALGELRRFQGRFAEAESYYREGLDACRRTLGDDHRRTLFARTLVGLALRRQGRLAEAEPLLVEALNGLRRIAGNEDRDTLWAIGRMAELRQDQGRSEEAERLYVEALDGYRRALSDSHPDAMHFRRRLATLLAQQGRHGEADSLLRAGLDACRTTFGALHPRTLNEMSEQSFLLAEAGRSAEAEALARQSVDGLGATQAPPSPSLVYALRRLSLVLRDTGQFEEAVAMLEEEKRVHRAVKMGARESWLWIRHAECLGKLNRFADAERELLECHGLLSSSDTTTPKDLRAVVAALIKLHDVWHAAEPAAGHDARAAEWRDRLSAPETTPRGQQDGN